MGLRSADGLRAFCDELAEDIPSPGGGSAAAAAGAMAAALLAMACGITAKSKKHADSAERMLALRRELLAVQRDLLENAKLDAEAYDGVVEAARRRRDGPGEDTDRGYESALKRVAEVPMITAEACAKALEVGVVVAEQGTRSAASDIGTALSLAEACIEGAAMNVRTNLRMIKDKAFARRAEERLGRVLDASNRSLVRAREKLGHPF